MEFSKLSQIATDAELTARMDETITLVEEIAQGCDHENQRATDGWTIESK
jgi:hypothetical protein